MLSERQKDPGFQSTFYRDHYRKILNSFLVSVFVMILLIATIIYLVLFKPLPTYYATTPEGKNIPMIPISR